MSPETEEVVAQCPTWCPSESQETPDLWLFPTGDTAQGNHESVCLATEATFSAEEPIFTPYVRSGASVWTRPRASKGSGHFEEQTDQSPPGLLLPQRGENVGQEKQRESKPNRLQSDPNSSFSQRSARANRHREGVMLSGRPRNTHYLPRGVAASGAGRASTRTHDPAPQGSEQNHHPGARDGPWRNGLDQGPEQESPRQSQGQHARPREPRRQATWSKVSVRVLQGPGQRRAGVGLSGAGRPAEGAGQGPLPVWEAEQRDGRRGGPGKQAGPQEQHQAWLLLSSKLLVTPRGHSPGEALSM